MLHICDLKRKKKMKILIEQLMCILFEITARKLHRTFGILHFSLHSSIDVKKKN